ncbi:MAG: hypothetical protein ACKO0X_04300 [Bacteroidota bacterium]
MQSKNEIGDAFRSIVSESTSPLFRIMWVFGSDTPQRRHFDNNIIAFHIGQGYFLSVAHNLRTECSLVRSMPESVFDQRLAPLLSEAQRAHLERCYVADRSNGVRFLELHDPSLANGISETFRSSGFDTRWVGLESNGVCSPHLILQFQGSGFFGDQELGDSFPEHCRFYEGHIQRHTYLMELELVKAFYSSDIALYRIKPPFRGFIDKLPVLDLDFSMMEEGAGKLYCLQSSPGGFLGRLLNTASLEGYLDQHQVFHDRIEGNYILEGFRYLIRGYFRFGSSGAPYLIFDAEEGKFKANAVQSEASPVQLSINHSREGNFQYVNAIASPLLLIEKDLKGIMAGEA